MKRFTLFIAVLLCAFTATIQAEVPKLINFQGILRNGLGNPVTDSTYSVNFRIYDAPAGGNLLWQETRPITTSSGLFVVLLGAVTPVPDSVFNDTTRYLGIQIAPDPEMTPREELVSVPYAYRVSSVDEALGGNIRTKVSIGPGHANTGTQAFVAGANNNARGAYSVVSGGGGPALTDSNLALGNWSSVGGGKINLATQDYTTVGGGILNTASGQRSTVAGGDFNAASDDWTTVGGGTGNTASGPSSTVAGGFANIASGNASTIGGGAYDTASGQYATVAGGLGNHADFRAAVGGGESNIATGGHAVVGGGLTNLADGQIATVPGGVNNVASGYASFAAGSKAQALHDFSFVWSDQLGLSFISTEPNQFLIHADSGVGIGTNSPIAALDVAGSVAVGSGTPIQKILSASAALNFPSAAPLAFSDLSITVTGASVGDVVSLGVPVGSMTTGAVYTGFVSAANTVIVRFTNGSGVAENPATGTFRAMVTKF